MKKIITTIALALSFGTNAQIINAYAGNGTSGYIGDGGQATAAEINGPQQSALDAHGNLYIADRSNNVIRKVTSAGIISTVAGSYTLGADYTGDGGPATAAQLNFPNGVTVDGAGNIYIADSYNHAIRIVNTAGIISTYAGDGSGTQGYLGDGGPATSAQLNDPQAVTVDAAGNLYITDSNNNAVRMVNTAGIISTYAGDGTGNAGYMGDGGQATNAELNNPVGIAVDGSGNIFVSEYGNSVIRKVSNTGIISTVAGNQAMGATYGGDGGLATAANLSNPIGVAVDAAGNIYVSDFGNFCIRKVMASTGIISTIAGTPTSSGYSGDGGAATSALLNYPGGVSADASGMYLYISDLGNNAVRLVSPSTAATVNSATICAGGSATLTANGATTYSWSPVTGLSTTTGSTTVANPTVTTIYTVTASSSTQTVTLMDTVTVNSLPTVSVTLNTATVCAGTMDTLTANSPTAISYTWSTTETTMSVTPSPTVTSTYSVMGTDANNCINWATATINVNALPTLTITASAGFSVCPNTVDTLKASGTATSYTWNATHAVTDYTVHPFNNTTYTLTGVGANGCKNKLTQLITVYPRPTLTVTATSGTVCTGNSTTLSTTTGTVTVTSYSWSTGATTPTISVSPVLTSTYSVEGFSSEGCATTKHYTVTVNALPTVTAASNMDTICINGTATLTAGGASTYIWNTSATTASIPVTLTVTTTYTVIGTDGNGCENMATVTQSVSTTCYEGIEQYNGNSANVSVYPNPNNGSFVITTNENAKTIIVTDILGNELVSINPKGNTTNNINLSAQPSGVYFIKVIAGNTQTVKRIIISN
jgi:sugar lactone lactonase YvrE